MNLFNVPFNFDPVETTVETTTYSLAAGKYAKITPIQFNAALVINGESVLPQLSGTGEVTGITSGQQVFENDTGYNLILNWQQLNDDGGGPTTSTTIQDQSNVPIAMNAGGTFVGSSFTTSSGSYTSDNTNYSTYFRLLGSGEEIVASASSSTGRVRYSYFPQNPPVISFWAHGGNSGITITGGKFVVELYNSIQ